MPLFLGFDVVGCGPKSAGDTKVNAVAEDPSAPLADIPDLLRSHRLHRRCRLCALAGLIVDGRDEGGADRVLAVLSVLLSWGAVHTVFALRYARLFYGNSPKGAGIDFNEDDPPDYRDFAYLAMTIGMTFQVSDTDLRTKNIRRAALRHTLISWLFGAVLVGLTINILASLLSGGGGGGK